MHTYIVMYIYVLIAYCYHDNYYTQAGLLAQSVERGADNAKVVSSNLTQTIFLSSLSVFKKNCFRKKIHEVNNKGIYVASDHNKVCMHTYIHVRVIISAVIMINCIRTCCIL